MPPVSWNRQINGISPLALAGTSSSKVWVLLLASTTSTPRFGMVKVCPSASLVSVTRVFFPASTLRTSGRNRKLARLTAGVGAAGAAAVLAGMLPQAV